MKDLREKYAEYFDNYPNADVIFVATDGNVFLKENMHDGFNHQKQFTEKNPDDKLIPVYRNDPSDFSNEDFEKEQAAAEAERLRIEQEEAEKAAEAERVRIQEEEDAKAAEEERVRIQDEENAKAAEAAEAEASKTPEADKTKAASAKAQKAAAAKGKSKGN